MRIGYENISLIRQHPWFNDVSWEEVNSLKIKPPIVPKISDKFDIENFNKDVTKESTKLSCLKEIDQGIVDTY